ncbi:MAG: hypothetical protein EPN93_20075 [Spirochaetes bacterium]|nr:MAG: hypothetical protein EPN93_20075 [Spirochaetota bacterium]
MRNHLHEILTALVGRHVRFIVCGGVALVLHGIERMTLDIDLSVDFERDNLKRFLEVMTELNLVPRVPVPAETLLDEEKRAIMIEQKHALVFTFLDTGNPYRQVDVFLTEKNRFENLIDDTVEADIGGAVIKVVSVGKLIEMKESVNPPRDKDAFDIDALKKLEGGR